MQRFIWILLVHQVLLCQHLQVSKLRFKGTEINEIHADMGRAPTAVIQISAIDALITVNED